MSGKSRDSIVGRIVSRSSERHVAAGVTGFIGFAVGRTTWLDAVTKWRAHAIGRETAVAQIARRFREWVAIFEHVSVH